MVPSALRFGALALLAAAAALFAFPALRHGVDPARADENPTAPAAEATSRPTVALQATPTLARGEDGAAPAAAPAEKPKPQPRGYTTVRIRAGRAVALRAKPRGPAVARLASRTEFGSKRVLSVAAVRGRWLGVTVTERPNGKLGWID